MVVYTLKPQPGDKRNVSQADILNNFTYLQTSVGNDHNFTANTINANDGLHKQSTYFGNVDPVTTAAQVALYGKQDAAGIEQVWFRPLSSGTPVQLTAKSTTGGTVPTVAAQGVTFLPGGLLLQWGNATSSGAKTIPFTIAFKAGGFQPSVTFCVTGTIGGAVPLFVSASNTLFTISQAGIGVYWMAIGQA